MAECRGPLVQHEQHELDHGGEAAGASALAGLEVVGT